MTKPPLRVLLASPRGFCAGVERAIHIVETALAKFGAPVYVRHEIVHNRVVVTDLEDKGAVFINELDEAPDDRPVIFSAHGVPKSVPAEAAARNLLHVDATCPLVTKVHREVEHHHAKGRTVALIGHRGHPEVIGTMGQLPRGAVVLVETVADARALEVADGSELAYVTQTTLSIDECADIIAALGARFPGLHGPRREDICYATTNRQMAVKEIAARCDVLLVIGAPNSSNSMRLVEVGDKAGAAKAHLVQRADDIDWQGLHGAACLGISAGASAPEAIVTEVLDALATRFDLSVEAVTVAEEALHFGLPRVLMT